MVPNWVFLDRDGTLNVSAAEHEYISDPATLRLLPGAGDAVARLTRAGAWVGVVTNQRGVGRGSMTAGDVDAVHVRLGELLAAHGGRIDGIWTCPHLDGECDCRKPLPGLLLQARRDVPAIDFARGVMIGDAASDVAAGRAVGLRTVRIGAERGDADLVAPDLSAAVALLLDR